MNRDRFWLTEAQFARIAAASADRHAGQAASRRSAGDQRHRACAEVRRALGRCAARLWATQDALQPLCALGRQGRLGRTLPCSCRAGGPPAQVLIDSSAVKAHRSASGRQRGEHNQAIGRSRGGRTTKIHALTDRALPAHRLPADRRPGRRLHGGIGIFSKQMPPARILHGDKGYDSNAIRHQVEENGTMPNIPPKANRRWKNCFSPVLYRDRNAIERMFCRLKDFRRIATRYDRIADNFLAAVCLAATVSYWL